MPVMNGIEATKQIRELEKEGSIVGHFTIIATTANTREEQRQEASEAGMVSLRTADDEELVQVTNVSM